MAAQLCCFVLFAGLTLFHQQTEAVYSPDLDRVLLTFNRESDNCREITGYSQNESRTAADKSCDQAFKSLDQIGLNTCYGWRNAQCRLIDGYQYQCSCTISYCDDLTIRSKVVIPFRDCAPVLLDHEQSAGQSLAPTAHFQQVRSQFDDAWQARTSQPSSSFSVPYNPVGSSSDIYISGGPSSSWGPYTSDYGKPNPAYPAYSLAGPSGETLPDPGTGLGNRLAMPRRHECDQCDGKFRSFRALYEHKKAHHTVGDTHCYLCNFTYGNRGTFRDHIRKKHPEIAKEEAEFQLLSMASTEVGAKLPYACTGCKKRFSSQKYLTAHMKSHTTDETKCRICTRVLSTKEALKNHIKNVHPGKPLPRPGKEAGAERYPCSDCGKSFLKPHSLQEHEKSHVSLETYCIFCKKLLSTKNIYKQHIENFHPEYAVSEAAAKYEKYIAENPKECAVCKRRFKNARGLRDHKQVHDGQTTCDVCHKTYARRSVLAYHKKKEHSK